MGIDTRWLSAKSAMAYLDLKDIRTIYAWAADGTLPGVKRIVRRKHEGSGKGRHRVTLRVDKTQLDRWLEGRTR